MKRTDRFVQLKNLFKKLRKAEKEILIAQAMAYKNSEIKGYEKIADVLQLISLRPDISQAEAVKSLGYTRAGSLEFTALLRSTTDMMLENLTLNINAERPKNLSNRTRIANSNAKKLIQSRILLSRNYARKSLKLLEDVYKRGLKYELFSDSVEACKQMQFIYSLDKGVKPYKRIATYLQEARELNTAYDLAQEAYMEFSVYDSQNNAADGESAIAKSIAKLDKILEKHKINYAAYLREHLKTEYHLRRVEMNKALDHATQLLKIIRDEPAVQSDQREGLALLTLSKINCELEKFHDAKLANVQAAKFFKKNSYESYAIHRNICRLALYEKKYEDAEKQIRRLLASKFTERWPFAIAQYKYYLAAQYHLRDKYNEANEELKGVIAAKAAVSRELIFNSYVLMYMNGFRQLSQNITSGEVQINEALKELTALYENDATLSKREKTIVRLIKRIESYDRNLDKTMLFVKDSASRLGWDDTDYRLNAYTDEIVPFQEFLTSGNKARVQKKVGRPRKKTVKAAAVA